jgi:hypothetical protein
MPHQQQKREGQAVSQFDPHLHEISDRKALVGREQNQCNDDREG